MLSDQNMILDYFHACVLCHVNVMSTGFTALGEMAMALAKVGAHSVMGPLLPRVADQIKEAISVKGRARPNCPEALQCVGVLAQALGSTWKTEATSLAQPMMSTGLSQPLVKTLQVGLPIHLVCVAYGSK